MKPLHLLSVLIVLALPAKSLAQAGAAPPVPVGAPTAAEEMYTRDTLSQTELKRLAEQIEQWSLAEGKGTITPQVARSRAAAMVQVLKVDCPIADAAYRGTSPEDPSQHFYEVSCDKGMGYLFLLRETSLSGVSCLSKGGHTLPVDCALPANADRKLLAASILRHRQVECRAREVNWLGASAANLEHVEVACENGTGHVIRSPRPGEPGTLDVLTCADAGKLGIACKLTAQASSAPPSGSDSRPTLSWFQEMLGRNGVTCETRRARIVGRESIKRRYVVEFECADHPDGLIAFVPSAGDAVNTLESMNCATAAERSVRCEFLPGQ
jgi:hypothetical protein